MAFGYIAMRNPHGTIPHPKRNPNVCLELGSCTVPRTFGPDVDLDLDLYLDLACGLVQLYLALG